MQRETFPSHVTRNTSLLPNLRRRALWDTSRWPSRPDSPRPTFLSRERRRSSTCLSVKRGTSAHLAQNGFTRLFPNRSLPAGVGREIRPVASHPRLNDNPDSASVTTLTQLMWQPKSDLLPWSILTWNEEFNCHVSHLMYGFKKPQQNQPQNRTHKKRRIWNARHILHPPFRVFQMLFCLLPQCSLLWLCQTLLAHYSEANKVSRRTAP